MAESEHVTILWRGWHTLIWHRYSSAWFERYFKIALPVSILLFALATAANTLAGIYAADVASNSVTDIILSNVPVVDVDIFFVYSGLVFMGFVLILLLLNPRKIPFVLCALALFYIIRALFVSMTHIGPYPDHAALDFQSKIILLLWGGGDEFFSGHTGAPFLFALIFWREVWLRYFFLAVSILFAGVVLLGHLHYTIDVLSAFFITYTIYQIARYLFPRELALFESTALSNLERLS